MLARITAYNISGNEFLRESEFRNKEQSQCNSYNVTDKRVHVTTVAVAMQ